MAFTETAEHDSSGFALQTRNVHKFYGAGKSAFHVLQGMDMDAPYGTMWVRLNITARDITYSDYVNTARIR